MTLVSSSARGRAVLLAMVSSAPLFLTCKASAQPRGASLTATAEAVLAFQDGCAAHLGDASAIKAAVEGRGFLPAPAEVVGRLTRDASDRVWILPGALSGVSVVMTPGGASCRVYLQRGDLGMIHGDFIRVAEAAGRPGMPAQQLQDGNFKAGGQLIGNVAFRVPSDGGARLYSLTTNGSPEAMVAAIMSAGPMPKP